MLIFIVFACVWMAPTRADALLCGIFGCSCTVTATPLDFDDFNPLDGAQDSEGQIEVDCTGLVELSPTLVVQMQSGTWGTISSRKMRSGAGDLLNYNIYTTSQHTVVWGNGTTGSTVTVSGGLLSLGHWQVTRAVYGLASPTAATKPGNYSDNVVVRIDW